MPNQPVEIQFGSDPTGSLTIAIRGRAYKQRRETWDGNWLLVDVTAQLPKFSAHVPGMLRAEELHAFSRELQQFDAAMRDAVAFITGDAWLELRVSTGQSGAVVLTGSVTDAAARDSALTFTLRLDALAFAAQTRALEQAVAAFPVLGVT